MKFKVGDQVKIVITEKSNWNYMKPYIGHITIITVCSEMAAGDVDIYYLENNGYMWMEENLVKI